MRGSSLFAISFVSVATLLTAACGSSSSVNNDGSIIGSGGAGSGGGDGTGGGPGSGGRTGGGGAPGSGGVGSGGAGSGGAPGSGGGIPAPPPGSPVAIHGQLHVCGTKICDAHDAEVQLKGVSSFWLAWATADRAYAEDLEGLKWMRDNWKLSVIRAAVGVEGNSNYLTDAGTSLVLATAIISNAIEAGVYVIVDWHTLEGHQAEAVDFFTMMAGKYGAYPNLIWEDYNEPKKVDWNSTLKPYHTAVINAIRSKDPDNIIILGTPNWSQYVDQAANSPMTGSNLLYTLHFYSCDPAMQADLRTRADGAIAKGIGLFVTEWGATAANGGTDGKVCLDEAAKWTSWMAQNKIGWTVWRLDNCKGATFESTCMLKATAPISGPYTGHLTDEGTFVAQELVK